MGLFGCNNNPQPIDEKPRVIKTDSSLTKAIKTDLAKTYMLNVTPEITDFKPIKGYTFASLLFNYLEDRYIGLAVVYKHSRKWEVHNIFYDKIIPSEKIINFHRGFSPNTSGPKNKLQFIAEDGYINISNVAKIKISFSDGFSETQTIMKGQKTFLFIREYNQSLNKIEVFDDQNKKNYFRTYPWLKPANFYN